MRLNKKKTVVLLGALFLSFASLPSMAGGSTTRTKTVVGSSYFTNDEWEYTIEYKMGTTIVGKLVYGYDTNAIDEDYAWTQSYEAYSTAMVKRNYYDQDYSTATEKGKNEYSKIEVRHITYSVSYRVMFSATYSEMGQNEAVKSNEKK